MADFVVYHTADRMGYSAAAVRGFSLLTNKNVPSVIGSKLWLITGEGTPRVYYLRGHFTPNRRTRTEESGFMWLVEGPPTSGVKLPRKRWAVLNGRPWFVDFRRSQGNFAFGLQAIRDERFIRELENALTQARAAHPTMGFQ
jgi:hypothetical protein